MRYFFPILTAAGFIASCTHPRTQPPPQPPISCFPCAVTVNLNVSGTPTGTTSLLSDNGDSYAVLFSLAGRASVTFPPSSPPNGWGATLTWATGSERVYVGNLDGSLFTPGAQVEGGLVGWPTLDFTPPLPPPPSRDALLHAQLTFQGLSLDCPNEYTGPVFDVMLDNLSPVCRAAFYTMKAAAGDKVIALAVSHAYLEPGIPPLMAQGHDWSGNLSGFASLVYEVIQNGFYIQLHLAGDGSTSACLGMGIGCYNDSVGWTYGAPWLIANFPIIATALGPYNAYIRYVPGFDGVFYGWSPNQVVQFGSVFRAALPTGTLGIEHDPGHIPIGEGGSDYLPGGRMRNYDFILGEFSGTSGDPVWQVLGRMIRPYNRPPEQPTGDDPSPPFYLGTPNPRGPWVYNCFEYSLYQWVRGQITAANIARMRQKFVSMGCTNVG